MAAKIFVTRNKICSFLEKPQQEISKKCYKFTWSSFFSCSAMESIGDTFKKKICTSYLLHMYSFLFLRTIYAPTSVRTSILSFLLTHIARKLKTYPDDSTAASSRRIKQLNIAHVLFSTR